MASVDQRGYVFAHAEGETRVTATLSPVRAEAAVSVRPPTVARYDLTGRVVNHNGKPVAAVLIIALDGTAAGQETRTGHDGRYFLAELEGETTVAARKDGYEEQRQLATGPPGELDFTLTGLTPRDSFGGGQWLVGDEIVPRPLLRGPPFRVRLAAPLGVPGCGWNRSGRHVLSGPGFHRGGLLLL